MLKSLSSDLELQTGRQSLLKTRHMLKTCRLTGPRQLPAPSRGASARVYKPPLCTFQPVPVLRLCSLSSASPFSELLSLLSAGSGVPKTTLRWIQVTVLNVQRKHTGETRLPHSTGSEKTQKRKGEIVIFKSVLQGAKL